MSAAMPKGMPRAPPNNKGHEPGRVDGVPKFPKGHPLNENREGGDERRGLCGRDYVQPYRRCNQPESKTRDTGYYGTD